MQRRLLPVCLFALGVATALAEGHGPVFGLATPTLGRNGWSSDTVTMTVHTGEGNMYMLREMIGYGITEDLQISLAFPVTAPLDRLSLPPRTRFGSMMTGAPEVELFGLWRFHREGINIGSRFESTLLLGGSIPTEDQRVSAGNKLEVSPSIHVAAVTGYASRSIYAWMGGGFQRYFKEAGDQLGELPYLTGVFGWRPPRFRHDWPEPDWRIFVEGLAEFPREDKVNGTENLLSGGTKVLLGPSLLGLYGKWGVSGGILFPVHADFDGPHPDETYRAKFVFTWWF
jgi:hypothetical protein